MDKELSQVIKSKVAIKAIKHVIDRVERFNKDYFPVKVKSIGIGGSSLRVARPKDIDISVKVQAVKEIWYEFKEFKEHLDNNFKLFVDAMHEIRKEKGRTTINDLIDATRDNLIKSGFKEIWIEKWLPWLRVEDIRYGINIGIPFVYFDIYKLIMRYLKSGWQSRRLEISQVIIVDPEGNVNSLPVSVSFLTIWTADKGMIIPSKEEIIKLFKKEYDRLIEKFERTEEHWRNREINNRFKNTKQWLKDLAMFEVTKIRDEIKDQGISSDTITKLSQGLKRLRLIDLIYDTIESIEIFDLLEIFRNKNPHKFLSEVLHRKLKREGYWKKDVENVLKDFDMSLIYDDLNEEIRRFEIGDLR